MAPKTTTKVPSDDLVEFVEAMNLHFNTHIRPSDNIIDSLIFWTRLMRARGGLTP